MSGDGYEYVREHYGVGVYVGQRVEVDGEGGIVVKPRYADQYIHVRFDESGVVLPAHPTWRVNYLRTRDRTPDENLSGDSAA
jgi:hypothetical protein